MVSWRDIPEWVALIGRPGLAALGPESREGIWTEDEITRVVTRDRAASLPTDALIALLLLWNDHHDGAHSIVQNMEQDADGSLVHAILHRREPDFGNAAYWFRRVGIHPSFGKLAASVQSLQPGEMASKLLPDGRWNPLGFCDACERVGRPASAKVGRSALLMKIQGLETEALLDDLWSRTSPR